MAEKAKQYTTPAGVAVYPHLHAPDTKYNAEGEYKTNLRMPVAEAQALMDILEEAAKAEYDSQLARMKAVAEDTGESAKKRTGARKAFKELSGKEPFVPFELCEDEAGELTGDVEFRFKLRASGTVKSTGKTFTQKPYLYDSAGVLLKQSPKVFSGSVLKVAFTVNPFYTAQAGAGVSLRMKAVQIKELVDSSGPEAAALGFDTDGEGFSADDVDWDAQDGDTQAPAAAAGGDDDDDFA